MGSDQDRTMMELQGLPLRDWTTVLVNHTSEMLAILKEVYSQQSAAADAQVCSGTGDGVPHAESELATFNCFECSSVFDSNQARAVHMSRQHGNRRVARRHNSVLKLP